MLDLLNILLVIRVFVDIAPHVGDVLFIEKLLEPFTIMAPQSTEHLYLLLFH